MSEILFDKIGGRPTLQKVHKIFYDKIYSHPWIGKFFQGIDQDYIENQQTDFMVDIMGGPSDYHGKMPHEAHKHMFITEELGELRSKLLLEALNEAGLSEENKLAWMKIDSAFLKKLIKKNLQDCERRFPIEPIHDHPNPHKKSA
jgi:hemoglobin